MRDPAYDGEVPFESAEDWRQNVLFGQDGLFTLDGPGQARRTDPETSQFAARFIRSRATSARVLLLVAHSLYPDGLTDEQAAAHAGLSMRSEYATRCSELMRGGALMDTTETREGWSGVPRLVRRITPFGQRLIERRDEA